MKKLTSIRHIQTIALGLLDYLDTVCKQHALRYFFIRGALIGAVRHKGFVPWDDDIDIAMPRPDYDRLTVMLRHREHPRYKLLTLRDGSDYFYEFAKLTDLSTHLREPGIKINIRELGIFIDIFPLDGMGDDYEEAKKFYMRANAKARQIASCVNNSKGLSLDRKIVRTARRLLYALTGRERAFERVVDELRTAHPFDSSRYIASTFGTQGIEDIFEHAVFASAIEASFEGRTIPIPIGYDAYLTRRYGDYMTLPSDEKRAPHHFVEIFCEDDRFEELHDQI
ncbi:MAG: LicD family protein [Mailhella sp.]|nr:LicD family protein [Mailhella sp.]